MTAPLPRPGGAAPVPSSVVGLDPPHEHGVACRWDVHECRWRCPPSGPDQRGT